MAFNFISAREAAELIKNGDTLGLSGFTAPGNPKLVLEAVAAKAAKEAAAKGEQAAPAAPAAVAGPTEEEIQAKIAGLDPEKAAKVRAALEAKAKKAAAAAGTGE